jgi:hypothetical protein
MLKSMQERMEFVKSRIGVKLLMTKPLKAGTFKNKVFGKSCTGYTFEIDTLSYRGSWVSTIEDIELTVDDEKVPKSNMLFCVNGIKIPIDDLGGHTEVFWVARDAGVIDVNKIGGLKPGNHKFEIVIKKRADFGHSYGEAEQGYENAKEFHNPEVIKDTIVYTVE